MAPSPDGQQWVPEAAAIDPEEYERLAREPRGFMAFRLRPRT
jgi:hypothetical protein